jgi:hypothetical protein
VNRIILIILYPVIVLAALFGLLAYGWQLIFRPDKAWRIVIGFDQIANVSFVGSEDETISSRAGKGARKGIWHWCLLCKFLHWIDPHHCEKNIENDEGKGV